MTLRDFPGPNAGYVLDLYERYRRDPEGVDESARDFFRGWTPETDGAAAGPPTRAGDAVGAAQLAQAVRVFGHRAARLDPLGAEPPGDPALDAAAHGLSEAALARLPATLVGGPLAEEARDGRAALERLREVYCAASGYDFGHVHEPGERSWLRESVESGRFRPPRAPLDAQAVLERLTRVEAFEVFLHRVFPGRTRFSIEGLDMLVPMLDELIARARDEGLCCVWLGMAHRGRLNVLAHVLGKPYAEILAEFKDAGANRDDLGWTGDVKYHGGARRSDSVLLAMPPNPSHLEMVGPLLQGMARAAGSRVEGRGDAAFDARAGLPVLIHGDAAFPGQGIVAETLNLSRLPGYTTGGAVHLIANNQLGYTTPPAHARSTLYASDLAKGFSVPVVHVNADDPVACLEAVRLAFGYRRRFAKDFVVDLIGYRRHGHNEGDEPSFTQPRMYAAIREHPTVRALWAERIRAGERAEELRREAFAELQRAFQDDGARASAPPPPARPNRASRPASLERLRELNTALRTFPEGFSLHRKLARFVDERRGALDDPDAPAIDWAAAEELALATILADGIPVRLTGQDAVRGTFSQRHARFHDVETGAAHVPLQALSQARAVFEVHDSPLSEAACLAFETGYSVEGRGRLVIWEAQYGDFVNNAQGVVDEYLASARAKWRLEPSVVLLLPHGYEGQGPDHSSARLERFLELSPRDALRVCNCTSAAQWFHLLREHAARLSEPLVVATPKSLLRHPFTASRPRDLAGGAFAPVLVDAGSPRVVVCSGKIAADLSVADHDATIVRVEQLAPFPEDALAEALGAAEEVVWAQEEPENMGPWPYVRPRLRALFSGPLRYAGRSAQPSPAEGSSAWHAANQAAIVRLAFDPDHDVRRVPMVASKEV